MMTSSVIAKLFSTKLSFWGITAFQIGEVKPYEPRNTAFYYYHTIM